ncbi:MAG: TIM-barrel domain-containing protein [Elusimicrobiota bacterium]
MTAFLLALLSPAFALEPYAETLGPGTAVFYASTKAAQDCLPSFAVTVSRRGKPGKGGVRTIPRFDGRVVTLAVSSGTSLYGTGEAAGPLLRNGRTLTLWNTDAYDYSASSPSLYQSHPWVLGVRPDGSSFGVLFDTTYRQELSLPPLSGGELRTSVEGPDFPVIVIERQGPAAVLRELSRLTGKMPLPPRWSLGYHQCRYSYTPDSRALEVAREFRKRRIPCDVLWHDIDYMRDFLIFTFSPQAFPDPARHNRELHALGFRTVWMIDPGVGAQPVSYPVFSALMAGGHAVLAADGSTFFGKVWPGKVVFPDFLRSETRRWWAGLYKNWLSYGVDGVWNDMNEPAVFETPTKTMPEDNIHRADAKLGGAGPHARYHNVYGMMMIRATREGIQAARPDRRPFVLTRSNFIGGQRYGATWTGDNRADWDHLAWSIPMVLNMGLSGQPNVGPDIGGFIGNGPEGREGELFARWMSFGALLPFSRGHTMKGNRDKEPWSFGPEVEKSCRTALERRYRLLPYLYTLFREASETGLPVARPIFFADLKDPALRGEDSSFLLGDGLLVATGPRPSLPKGGWSKFVFPGEEADPGQAQLYIKPGAAIPAGPVVQYSDEKPLEELTLLVCFDSQGRASGRLYEDAGDGLGFEKGEFRETVFRVTRGPKVKQEITGRWGPAKREVRTVVLCP